MSRPRFSKRNVALAAAAAAIMLAAAGCTANPAATTTSTSNNGTKPLAANCGKNKTFRIGFSQANNAEPYRQQVNAEIESEAKKYPEFTISIADGQGNDSKQISDVENFTTQKVDLLFISPFEAQPLTAPVSALYKSGTPVIELDRQTANKDYMAFVGGDNEAMGEAAGKYVAEKVLPNGGDVAVLEGLASTTPAVQRTEGFTKAVTANSKIKVVATQPADWLPDKAQTVFDAMLRSHPDIKAVYANNDLMANGAYLAVKAQNKVGKVAIIGSDGLVSSAGGVHAVLNGQFTATLVYPTGAAQALALAKSILVDCAKSVPRNTFVPTTLITKDNAQAYLDKQGAN